MESHLLQMRGLKPKNPGQLAGQNRVASFTDAWIETQTNDPWKSWPSVASFTDAWIETGGGSGMPSENTVASFTDAWIET